MRSAAFGLVLGGVATAWASWNAATVYLVFAGARQHRLETAMLLLVACAVLAELIARAARSPARPHADPGLGTVGRRALVVLARGDVDCRDCRKRSGRSWR